MCASDFVVTMLIATAAATWTEVLPLPPSLSPVAAFGVEPLFDFVVSPLTLLVRWLFALDSWSSDLPLTSLPEVSPDLLFAPFALAVAVLPLSDVAFAIALTAPPAP